MQRSKTALVLAGGGVAGAAYEIGALCAIDQLLDQLSVNEFDFYVGTSAGGLIAACLANTISPRTLLSLLESPLLGIDQLAPQHLFSLNLAGALHRAGRLPAAVVEAARPEDGVLPTPAWAPPLAEPDAFDLVCGALAG